jgi:uncharacterized Tic20 family protein
MTSHPTEPFDPIAGAPEPDDQGPRAGPPSGALAGPPGGVFAGPRTGPPSGPFTGPPTGPPSGPFTADQARVGSGPPDHHHEAPHHEPVHHEAVQHDTVQHDTVHREAAYPDAAYPDAEYAVAAHHEPAQHEPGYQDAGHRATAPASDPGQQDRQDGGDDDQLWAMMAYLGMIFFAFLPPLAVYLFRRRESRYVRFHAAQALNLWITACLYTISFLIIGGILALDTIATGLSVGIPLIAGTGIVMLLFAVKAALAAGRGAQYQLPGWICVQLVR